MAFFLNKTTIGSHFQATQNDALFLSRRQFHVEPGPRERALLAEDPSLKRFKSHKNSVRLLKRVGDVLTIAVVAGCCYEIYVKAVMREEARKQAKAEGGSA
ncbi:Succinate dehydrogenase subunit 7B, mitochondrial [Parasponia andersonii]|uniref:Succinate dehydrogenase subunit 7B, mitochondrial n=1 Tax=Parasponia andersonii TaxID=3476 RepID=A0A2P5CDH5_PARAD|nr:Succinate dehydrogenase subunit 7B, mitochondrial [Parasponia andersonii]